MSTDIWNYRNPAWLDGGDLIGYDVETGDETIGKVVEAHSEPGHARIVVDTSHWIFHSKRMIPAGAIVHVDHDAKVVGVNLTKEEIKGAPAHHDEGYSEQVYHDTHQSYYQDYGRVI